jgi:hypothetical protein
LCPPAIGTGGYGALCAVAGICVITGAFAILRVRGSDSTYIYDAPPTSESR